MIKRMICTAVLFAAQGAHAQAAEAGIERGTGTPSNATATVSPSTVAQAFDRAGEARSSFALSVGTSVSSGHFSLPSRSRIWATAVGLRYEVGGLRLTGSIPYMSISSAGQVIAGIDSTPVIVGGVPRSRRTTNKGLGDLTLGASYTLPANPAGLDIELSGRVKLPTASDSSGLSSGKSDFSAGIQLSKAVGRFAPFVSATYRVFGDSARFQLKDGFAGSVGTSILVGDRGVLLTSYHYAQRASRFLPDSHELFAGVSTPIAASRLRLTGFGTAGLSHGAAAISGGIGVAINL